MTTCQNHEVFLSVVIPSYNEAKRLPKTLQSIRDYLSNRRDPYEVIVVDDGSRDQTAEVVSKLSLEWPELRLEGYQNNRGKGWATRTGVLAARGKWVLCSDADLSTPIEFVETLLERGRQHQVVIGSRRVRGANIARQQPLQRVMMGRVYNLMACLAVGGWYPDTQCGFKLYAQEAAKAIFEKLSIEGFAFDVEVLFLSRKLGYSISQVPIVWVNDERSSVSVWKDPLKMFIDLFRIHWIHR